MPATPNVQHIVAELQHNFPAVIGYGICNCRNKRGSGNPSHHAWCNAIDIRVSRASVAGTVQKALGDAINAYLVQNRDRLGVYRILWWSRSTFTGNSVSGHKDHLHVVPWPYGIGTPPCMGGTLKVRHRNGTTANQFTDTIEGDPPTGPPVTVPPDTTEEEMLVRETWAIIQEALIGAGHDLGDFNGYLSPGGTQYPDGADGLPGTVTKGALTESLTITDLELTNLRIVDGTESFTITATDNA